MSQAAPSTAAAPADPTSTASAQSRTSWWTHLGVLALFVLVTAGLHFRFVDPYRLYCEDIEHNFLPQTVYTYLHPWEAFQGRPTPSCNFGSSNYLVDGGTAAVVPVAAAALSRLAPRTPGDLARFEWRITSLHVLLSMVALYLFLRELGAGTGLAAAIACSFPFTFTIFHEWRHVDLLRGRLLLAPVLLGLALATRRGGYRGWLALAAALVVCMAQANQLYWVAVLVVYWLAATAWRERSGLRALAAGDRVLLLRRCLPPLIALAAVVLALAPMYARGRAAIRQSALYDELARDSDRALYYLRDGRDWFSPADLAAVDRGFLPWSVAGLCVGASAVVCRRLRGGPPRANGPTPAGSGIDGFALGAPLLVGSTLLAFVPHLPDGVFAVRGDRLEWAFAAAAVAPELTIAFHTTVRTWLVLAEIGALLAGTGLLVAWVARPAALRDRTIDVAGGLLLFGGVLAAGGALSGRFWAATSHGNALLVVAGMLIAALLATRPRPLRILGQAALILMGVAFAARASSLHYEVGMERCRYGEANAAALLARDETLLARVPAEVRGQRVHRLFGEKWCYYLDAPCALSYVMRTLPRDVLRFFEAAGAVEDARLPYWLHLDYALLLESGIAQMLGIRWWILPADVMESGVLLTDEGSPQPLRLLEARGAFSKGWALESWETAASFDAAMIRVMELGRAGQLATRGVVQTAAEGPAPLPEAGAVTAGATAVDLLGNEPGRLSFRVRSTLPTVLATNEFFHPDWRVSVGGEPPAVPARINAAFVGAPVPAGEHEIVFERR